MIWLRTVQPYAGLALIVVGLVFQVGWGWAAVAAGFVLLLGDWLAQIATFMSRGR